MKLTLRIHPPVIFLLCWVLIYAGNIALPMLTFNVPYRVAFSVSFATLALLVGFSGVYALRKQKTTLDPMQPAKTNHLVTSGVYRYSRNPMYLALLILLIALAIRSANAAATAAPLFFRWYITVFQIKPEEESLKSRFGARYNHYAKQVRRWL